MIQLNINNEGHQGKHRCVAEREGDELVFRCPACPDYERRINTKTGKTTCKSDPENLTPHYGTFVPPGLDANLYVPN